MSYTFEYRTTPNRDIRHSKPEEIIIHHWGADGQSHNGVVSWLCNPRSGVSADYVVSAGRVTRLNDPSVYWTWHAGNRWHNEHSIGIECRPEHSAADVQTVAELVAGLWEDYGVLPIKEHRQVANTACPGRYSASDIYNRAMAIYRGGAKPQTPAKSEPLVRDGKFGEKSCLKMQEWLNSPYRDGTLSGQLKSQSKFIMNMEYCVDYGYGGSQTVKLLQKKVGATADGYLGKKTIMALQRFLNKDGHSLVVDGYAGGVTCDAFQEYLNLHVK